MLNDCTSSKGNTKCFPWLETGLQLSVSHDLDIAVYDGLLKAVSKEKTLMYTTDSINTSPTG